MPRLAVHVDRQADYPFLLAGRGFSQLPDFASGRSAKAGRGIRKASAYSCPMGDVMDCRSGRKKNSSKLKCLNMMTRTLNLV